MELGQYSPSVAAKMPIQREEEVAAAKRPCGVKATQPRQRARRPRKRARVLNHSDNQISRQNGGGGEKIVVSVALEGEKSLRGEQSNKQINNSNKARINWL